MVHTLSLRDTSRYPSGRFVCNICREPGCGPLYHCADCEFDVHVMCAATAKQQTHITHPHHLLRLVQCNTLLHRCDSCGRKIHTFSFRCHACDFDIHPTCVRAPRYIKHHRHPHPLTLSNSSTASDSLRCDACRMPVTDFFYQCDRPLPGLGTCNFILHQVCASLPTKVKHPKHPQHILTLLDQPSQHMSFSCGACGAQSKGWHFHCTSCNFNLDPSCASSVHEFAEMHLDPEFITHGYRAEATSSSAAHDVSHDALVSSSSAHDVSHDALVSQAVSALVPTESDLEAIEKLLRFAQALVKSNSLQNTTEDTAQSHTDEGAEDICPTCLEGYDVGNPKKITSCGHHFHLACLLNWMERSPYCAICRKLVTIPM